MIKRVDCQNCTNFIHPVMEDEGNLISKVKVKAKCKLGKRVMFRNPIFNRPTSMVAVNDYGWIRYCENFKK